MEYIVGQITIGLTKQLAVEIRSGQKRVKYFPESKQNREQRFLVL